MVIKEITMKALAATLIATALAFGAAAPAFAGDDKKCEEGMKWDEATQKCVKAES